MPELISIEKFLELAKKLPVFDVRSPLEFEHASFPGAISFPLMNNEERVIIGTTFKKEGRESAVIKGYELIGGKFADFIKKANELLPGKTVVMYCWRGGLRSNIMAFVLESAGFRVSLLKGGYKMFRKKVLEVLDQPPKLVVLGGMTGSGKTKILKELGKKGENIIDLEAIARHKGSAFGGLGELPQPGYEQFENQLALEILSVKNQKIIWVENESRMIGRVKIPDNFYQQMRTAMVIEIMVPHEERVLEIEKNYGSFEKELLVESTRKLQKKMGDKRTTDACNLLVSGDLKGWIGILLEYYDENYRYSSAQRMPGSIRELSFSEINPEHIAQKILEEVK